MKRIVWGCEVCHKEAEGASPPPGWIETSFWDRVAEKYRRQAFCSNECAIQWLSNNQERLRSRG